MKFVLSPQAAEDLREISEYTSRIWGDKQEDLYLEKLLTVLEAIGANPETYRLRADLRIRCRSALAGRHVIFFFQKDETAHIIRILHSSMDFGRHLPGKLF